LRAGFTGILAGILLTGLLAAAVWNERRRFAWRFRDDEAPASAAADLTALASCVPRFVGCPFVRRSLFMRGAPTLAGDLALLFWRHRRKPTTFFPFRCIHYAPP
jgi:hypothetical protein